MYRESFDFDNQTDAVSIIAGGQVDIDLTEEMNDAMSDTAFARKVLSYRHMTNKVQCLAIGRNPVSGATIYESFESACKRTFAR